MSTLLAAGAVFLAAGIAVSVWRAVTVTREAANLPPLADDWRAPR